MIEAAELKADIYPAGPRGLSAYEIYKKEGGQLSEEEWLKSLNGLTPTIGENGNWFLGTVDTGLSKITSGDFAVIKKQAEYQGKMKDKEWLIQKLTEEMNQKKMTNVSKTIVM